MISCKWIQNSLSDIIEGSLKEEKLQAVEAHIQQCPMCKNLRERVRKTMLMLESLHKIVPSETFDQNLREKLRRERVREHRRLWDRLPSFRSVRPWPAFAISIVIVAVGLGLIFLGGSLFQSDQPLYFAEGDDQWIERVSSLTESTSVDSPFRLTSQGDEIPHYVLPALSPQILELSREYRSPLWESLVDGESIFEKDRTSGQSHMQHTVRYVLPSAYPQATRKARTFNP